MREPVGEENGFAHRAAHEVAGSAEVVNHGLEEGSTVLHRNGRPVVTLRVGVDPILAIDDRTRILTDARLRHAIDQLRLTSRTVTDIALEGVFETPSQLDRVFRQAYQTSPGGFRTTNPTSRGPSP